MRVLYSEKNTSYRIIFSNKIKEYIKKQSSKYKKIAVIADTNLWKHYGKEIGRKDILNIKIEPGERSKSIKTKNYIEDLLLKNNFNRNSLIIAIGGGVIGDLVGFTASTFMRGVALVHIPTSLIAIVDSSIGGKTAIDNKYGKNLIGTFYNPKEIIINLDFLKSLPNKEIRQGMAEIIKYSIIDSKSLFISLNQINKQFLLNKKSITNQIIKECIKIKIKTVESDFKESDKRMILNFGHTVGHALEKFYKYKKSHGDCIGFGMLVEAKIANKINHLSSNEYDKIKELLNSYELINLNIKKTNVKELLRYMRLDKKNLDSSVTFSLPKKIGSIIKTRGKHSIQIKDKIIIDSLNTVIDEIKN